MFKDIKLGLAGNPAVTPFLFTAFLLMGLFFSSPALAWEKEYIGDEDLGGYGNAVIEDSNGGFFIAADSIYRKTDSDTLTESSILKTDADGNLLWTSGSWMSPYSAHGYSVALLGNGDPFLVGSANYGSALRNEIFLIKFINQATIIGHQGQSGIDEGKYVVNSSDGKVIITGQTDISGSGDNRLFLMKYDPLLMSGNNNDGPTPIWTKTFVGGTSKSNSGSCVQQTNDGGLIVVGSTGSSLNPNKSDIFLLKTNQNGDEQWRKTIGGPEFEGGYYVIQTLDGGYAIVGMTNSYGSGKYDINVVKVDSMGNLVWDKSFGGLQDDKGYCIRQTTDGGYILSGVTKSYSSDEKIIVIKLDASGNETWRELMGGGNDPTIKTRSYITKTSNGNYMVVGSRNNNIYATTLEIPVGPEMSNTYPQSGENSVNISSDLEVEFKSTIQAGDLSRVSVKDSQGTGVEGISASVASGGVSLIIKHAVLKEGETHTVTVGAGTVKSQANGLINQEIKWSFTTVAPSGPETAYMNPYDGQCDVNINSDVEVVFDSEILAGDLNIVSLEDSQGAIVEGVSSEIGSDGTSLQIKHPVLKNSETYSVTLNEGVVKSKTNGQSNQEISWSFTTAAPMGPELYYTNPWDGETNVYTSSDIEVSFDCEIQAGDLNLVSIKDSQGAVVEGVNSEIESLGTSLQIKHPVMKNSETYLVTIGVGAVMGRANGLSNQEISWRFTTIAPIGPELSYTNPWDGETDVYTSSDIEASFDCEIQAGVLNLVNIKDSQGAIVEGVSSVIGSDGTSLIIKHPVMKNSETYTVTVGVGAVKSQANGLSNQEINWSYTTTAAATGPELSYTNPWDGATNVYTNSDIAVGFDREIQTGDMNLVNIKDGQGAIVEGVSSEIGSDGTSLIIKHSVLKNSETFTVTIGAGAVKSQAEGTSNQEFSWSFTTDAPTGPVLSYANPWDGETNVYSSDIVVTFDSEIQAGDLNLVNLKDSQGVIVEGVSSEIENGEDTSLRIKHPVLKNSETYTVTLGAGAINKIANGLSNQEISWSFTTTAPTGPLLSYTSPWDEQADVQFSSDIEVGFDSEIQAGDLNLVSLKDSQGALVEGVSSEIGSGSTSLQIQHPVLKNSETYTVAVGVGAVKSQANGLSNQEISWSFTTVASTGPELSYTNPWDEETDVYTNSDIEVVFEREIQAGELTLVSLKDSQGALVGEVSSEIENGDSSLKIQHPDLKNSETYTVTVGAGAVKNKANGLINEEISWSFSTTAVLTGFGATPLVQIGINPNDGDSAGIFVGLKDIRDFQGNIVPDAKLAEYQIEVNYDHNQAKVLGIIDEAHLGQITLINEAVTDKLSVAVDVENESDSLEKLFFVPLELTGSSINSTNVIIKFTSLTGDNSNHINIPDVTLTFQRGKIYIEASQPSISISDAVAGLKYLAQILDAGSDQGKVNVVNMASIQPPEAGTTRVKPGVGDIVALMQSLVGFRDDSFQLVTGP